MTDSSSIAAAPSDTGTELDDSQCRAGVESRRLWLPVALIVGLGFLLYIPGHNAPFIFDDLNNIVFDDVGFVHRLWPWGPLPLHRALGTWTLQLNYALHGLNPTGFRLVNIAIHVTSACVLLALVRKCLARPGTPAWLADVREWLAARAALIWLVHPIQAQAVTYIVQRYESLMALCYLLTLYCIVCGAESKRSWIWYVAAIAACFAGVASKEVMISAPIVALLLDRAYLATSWREVFVRRWGLYLGLFAADAWLILVASGTLFGSANDGAGFDIAVTPWQYLRSQPAVLLHYLRIAFWPDVLLLDYGWAVESSPWRIYGLGAIIVGLLAGSVLFLWRQPRFGVIAIAFFLILAPSSSFIPLADLAFDHRAYLPLASVVLLVLVAAALLTAYLDLKAARRERLLWIGTVAVMIALSLRTLVRNAEFRNPIKLWLNVAAQSPERPRVYISLAKAYKDVGRMTEAQAAFDKAVSLAPDDSGTLVKYGHFMLQLQNLDRAVELYRHAVDVLAENFEA